jgi:tetratricopeptide (TPR) repeat protein
MRKYIATILFSGAAVFGINAQIQRPMASPQGKVEQKVGLTDIKVEYYRPSKNNRTVFGDVVPFGELWRTGANENTKFTCSDPVVFGKDTLKTGTYAIFTKPAKDSWEIIFYTDINNWGTPDEFDEKKVALRTSAKVTAMNDVTETFTISLDNLTIKTADLNLTWDKTRATLTFSVPTAKKMNANIDKAMAGPSANDYYAAAEFYYKEKQDMKKALEWVNKSVEARPQAYWILRLKSLIQAELGDYKGAIETAKLSMEAAEKDGDKAYVEMNKASIEEWSKKKK